MIWVDGIRTSAIPVSDRGFQYGDGCFTTLEVADGVPLFLQRHMARLSLDASRLGIPYADFTALTTEAQQVSRTGGEGVLKIFLTRGEGGRGYRWPDPVRPTRVLSFHPLPTYPASWRTEGVVLRWCAMRLGCNPRLAGIKHMNRLEQVLARGEWSDPDIAEGLLLDAAGYLVEGTMSNVFWVTNGRLHTPRVDRCGVAGVMRDIVIDEARRQRIPVCQVRRRPAAALRADELFVTNSVIGLWPVRRLADRVWPALGPIIARLASAVAEAKRLAREAGP